MNWRKLDKIVKWLITAICVAICYVEIRLTLIWHESEGGFWHYLNKSKFFDIESELFIALAVLVCYLVIRGIIDKRQKQKVSEKYRLLWIHIADLYYKQDWKTLKSTYEESDLPRIRIDLFELEMINSCVKVDKMHFKATLTWEKPKNETANRIMNVFIRDAYWHFIDIDKLLSAIK